MAISPDAKLDHGVHARADQRAAFVADCEIEEVYGLDYGRRERDEKKKDGGDECGEDRK